MLNPKVGLIWGDGIDPVGIEKILNRAQMGGIAAENFVFGMGGGLLQKVNRDTQRFAFKCSAQERNGKWHDVFKNPLDATKASKAGRLCLCLRESGEYVTLRENETPSFDQRKLDVLELRFENGEIHNSPTFDQVRARAK